MSSTTETSCIGIILVLSKQKDHTRTKLQLRSKVLLTDFKRSSATRHMLVFILATVDLSLALASL